MLSIAFCEKIEIDEMIRYGVRIEGGMALVPNTWVEGYGNPVGTVALPIHEAWRIFKGLPDPIELLESKIAETRKSF